jgi:hypothetical protein
MQHEVSLPYKKQPLILSYTNLIYAFPFFINFYSFYRISTFRGGIFYERRSRWPSGLSGSEGARLMGLRFRIPSLG